MLTLAPAQRNKRNSDIGPMLDREPVSERACVSRTPAGLPRFLCHGATSPPAPVQARLSVNTPGDAFEEEADQVADRATGATHPGVSASPDTGVEDRVMQRKGTASPAPGQTTVPADAIRPPDAGVPLNERVRNIVEPLLGMDLSAVRVHESREARESAEHLQARAFTHRDHIWLGPGENQGDENLMAHEATHVAQQTSGATPSRPSVVQRLEAVRPAADVSPMAEGAGTLPQLAGWAPSPEPPRDRPILTDPAARERTMTETRRTFGEMAERSLGLEDGYLRNPDESGLPIPEEGQLSEHAANAIAGISEITGQFAATLEAAAAREHEKPVDVPKAAEEPRDRIPPESEPEAVAAEIEAARPQVDAASVPVGDIDGPGPETEAAAGRLRALQESAPELVAFGEAISERIAGLRSRTAINTTRVSSRLKGEAPVQREAIRASIGASNAAVSGIMGAAHRRVSEGGATADETLAQLIDEAHDGNSVFTEDQTSCLQESVDGAVEQSRDAFAQADTTVQTTGTQEAERGRDHAFDLATRALELGRNEAARYRRSEQDEDVGEDKAEAVTDVAAEFASQLRSDGRKMSSDVTEQAGAAREQITAEEEPTVAGFSEAGPQAVEGIQTFLASVADGIDTIQEQGAGQLQAAESGVQAEIDNVDQAATGRGAAIAAEAEANLDAAVTSGLLSQAKLAGQAALMLDSAGCDALDQLVDVGTGSTAANNPEESMFVQRKPANPDAGLSTPENTDTARDQDAALSQLDSVGNTLDQAADAQTDELAAPLCEIASGAAAAGDGWVSETASNMDGLACVAEGGFSEVTDGADTQLDGVLDDGHSQAESEVDRISEDLDGNVSELRDSLDGGVDEACQSLEGGVDEGIQHADETIGELPIEMQEAADAQEGWLSSLGHWVSKQLSDTWEAFTGIFTLGFVQDLLVGLAAAIVVGLVVAFVIGTGGLGAALIIGAAAGAAGFAAGQMSANVRNGDPLMQGVGHALVLGAFVGAAGAAAGFYGLGLAAGTGLVMLGAGVGTVVANVATGREWDDHLVANILIIGIFHAIVKSATDRLPPSWRLPTRRTPPAEEPAGEIPARPEPKPSETPPPGMSPTLEAIRSGLTDPRAIESFDAKFESLGRDVARMEKIVDAMSRGGNLEARLIAEWERGNPAPRGEALDQVPGLRNRAGALQAEIEEYVNENPSAGKLLADANDAVKVLDEMLSGQREAATDAVQGERNNLNGIEAEFRESRAEPGQPSVGRSFSLDGREGAVEVDVVAENGLTWIESKNVEPFGLESSNWTGKAGKQGMQTQAQEMVRSARQNPVDGQTPQVVWSFPAGVSVEVAAALRSMGITVRGQVSNIPPPVTPKPPSESTSDEEKEPQELLPAP